jgi:uncharacterized protein YqjF (DUF2071 family)
MAKTLIKGKLRKVLNRALKMSSYELPYYSMCMPFNVTNVRMYVDNDRWACYKYIFEVDIEVTVPIYKAFRFSDNRYISSTLRRRLSFKAEAVRSKCHMFSGNDGNTEVVYKKISIIRNDTPPSLKDS